eukprot:gene9870-1779_t
MPFTVLSYTKPLQQAMIALALLAHVLPASAWWCGGHMLTAQIAYDQLTPEIIAVLNPIIEALNGDFPSTGPTLTESACWADDIKHDTSAFDAWHFIDYPLSIGFCHCALLMLRPVSIIRCHFIRLSCDPALFAPCASPTVEQVVQDGVTAPPPNDMNVAWAIQNAVTTLGNANAGMWAKSMMLRFLVHFVGDIHQPLHCASLFNNRFNKGNRGGNYFTVTFQNQSTELHAVWDGAVGLYTQSFHRPLSGSDPSYIQGQAASLVEQHPHVNASQLNSDYLGWANESLDLARTIAYGSLSPGDTLSNQYVEQGQTIAGQQLVLGGMRLANILSLLYNNTST